MIAETLVRRGCVHQGHDGTSTPAMFYPEWIGCVIQKAIHDDRHYDEASLDYWAVSA